MSKEIALLRMQLANQAEDIEKMKLAKILELDRAREQGYIKAESRLLQTIKTKE